MSAPYHYIRSKLDRALVLYLVARDAGTAADIFPAKRSLDLPRPCTVCWTERATPIRNTGSYTCQTSIIVKHLGAAESGEDPSAVKTASDERVGKTFDAFFTIEDDTDWDSKKVAQQITALARAAAVSDPTNYGDLSDFTVLDVRYGDEEGGFEENTDTWVETLNLQIDACPADVS